MGTLLVSIALVGVITAIVVGMIKAKKRGKILGCDCGCDSCPKSYKCS